MQSYHQLRACDCLILYYTIPTFTTLGKEEGRPGSILTIPIRFLKGGHIDFSHLTKLKNIYIID